MPQFVMPIGDGAATWNTLDLLTQSYVEAMFFTEIEDDGRMSGITFDDLAPETVTAIKADCAKFLESPEVQKAFAILDSDDNAPGDVEAGRDFWFTRNGHGCGFWDGDWPEPFASELTKLCRNFPEVDIYPGDDGRIYLA